MKITFLGTGTSIGVPAIGCRCPVCRSRDPRNRRRRASLYVAAAGCHLVIDTPPDFREQVLTFKVPRLDALLLTHAHTDHIVGFDDIRRFNVVQGGAIPVYGHPATLRDLLRIFPYIRNHCPPGLAYPRVVLRAVTGPFRIGPFAIEPIPVEHANLPTFGYRLAVEGRTLAYVPDCRRMASAFVCRLRGVEVMILDALRPNSHPTHLNLRESAALLRRIGARRSFVTHLGHQASHVQVQRALPAGITVPHDGLALRLRGRRRR